MPASGVTFSACSRRTIRGLLAVCAAVALTPAGASAATVDVTTTGNDASCAPGGAACRSIEKGVAVAGEGDIVQVGAGDFPVFATDITGVHITKRLDLRGAQYGVDARTRNVASSASETVLHPAGNTPYQGLLYVDTGAAGTSIRGFKIQGTPGSAAAGGGGIFTQQTGTDGGYRISENVITGNTIGLLLSSSGPATVVSHNAFVANTINPEGAAGGNGIYSERAHNVQILDNRFEDNQQTAVFTAVGADNTGTKNVFRGNRSIDEPGPVFVNQADLTVEDNTVTGGNFAGIALGGDGLHDAQVLNNTITGKSGEFTNGIRLINFGALQNRHVTIARNTVTGMRSSDPARGNGISLGAEGAAGTVHVERNRLVDNSGAGLRNEDPDADIVASHNWWGCNTGPGFSGCDAVTSPDGGSNPSFTPWLLLSFTANPTAIAPGGTSSLLADVANRSSGGAATGPFFTSGVATFGFTALTAFRALNAFSPTTVPLDANLKARSVFTAGAQPPKELSTTVDHQTVQMAISNPPKPDVVPDVIPDHKRLAPGQRTAVVVTLANRGNRTARAIRACLRLSAKLNFSGRVCRTIARLLPGHSVAFVVHVRARRAGCAAERRLVYRLIVRVRGQRTLIQRTRGRLLGGPCFTG